MPISATFVDADTFTVAEDRTAEFHVGRRVECSCGADGMKYGTISASAFVTVTTVDLTAGSDNLTANLVSVKYGIIGTGADHAVPIHGHLGDEGDGGAHIHDDTFGFTIERHLTFRPEVNVDEIKKQGVPDQVHIGIFWGYSLPVWSSNYEELHLKHEVPGRWDEASDVIFRIQAALASGEDVGDNFKFEVSWECAGQGTTIPLTQHDVYTEQAVLTGRNAQYDIYDLVFTLGWDIHSPTCLLIGDLIGIRLRRVDATNPDISGEVIVIDWTMKYKVNKLFKP